MEDLNATILRGFAIKPKNIVKNKHYYICDTNKGYIVIKKTFDNLENIIFQHDIKEHLYNCGFTNIDRFFLSTTQNPYFLFANSTYIATNYIPYNETEFSNKAQFEEVIKNIAIMHKLLMNVKFSDIIFYGESDIVLGYESSLQNFNNIKKRITSQSRLSDFDVIFLKNYSFYKKVILESISILNDTNIKKQIGFAKENNIVSHNLLKEENILINSDLVYITNFTNSNINPQILDISFLIRRYMKIFQQENFSITEIIHIYTKYNNSFTCDDFKILYPMLKFPYKYLKICFQYYSKKRTWAPSAIINRMETLISNKDLTEQYIETIYKGI